MGDADQFFPLHQIRFRSHRHGSESRALARELALRWTRTRGPDGSFDWSDLPPAATAGAAFATRSRGGSVSVLQGIDTGLWLMRREIIDPKVEGRVWQHDVFVADDGGADVIGVRTSVALGRNMVAPVRRPSIIAALVRNSALLDDKTQVQTKPLTVTAHDVAPVLDLLASSARTLPVLFINQSIRGRTPLDAQKVADKLAGFAHVLVVMPDAGPTVSQYLAQEMGVQFDALTLCWPVSAAARGAAHVRWDTVQAKDPAFWPFLEASVIRSSVGTMEDWLGSLIAWLAG
ncbi:hypothetical protein A8H39_00245 [Paraburkholderia fungorum]|uniref:hypothetical protein n=1 Tax=Paraburkholderia fungorum TaxID=134537 RepID=UPI000480C64A|nr:hypothetical protein [Paraburkholderia fungorum]PNE59613.1 hypothetical protein A8H39_00245 [Paraburkholderia fungorum]